MIVNASIPHRPVLCNISQILLDLAVSFKFRLLGYTDPSIATEGPFGQAGCGPGMR